MTAEEIQGHRTEVGTTDAAASVDRAAIGGDSRTAVIASDLSPRLRIDSTELWLLRARNVNL